MNRREWMRTAAAAAAATTLGPLPRARAEEPTPAHLPAWRGFNLLSMFYKTDAPAGGFPEADFDVVADLGFDFVRLPMDYRFWADPSDWTRVRDEVAVHVDRAVDAGRQRKIHVQLNFHRAPGFTVANPPEPRSLWKDPGAVEACAAHWAHFASRYKGRPNTEVSFNLLNEPTEKVTAEDHRRVVERIAAAIREVDADRLIVCDGRGYGRIPPTELLGLNLAASAHCYDPHRLTHYRAGWVEGSDKWPVPTWPLVEGKETYDRAWLAREGIDRWKAIEAKGVGVHIGEIGCHNRTPHPVVLSWLRDVLGLLREAGWGWALWNLHGSFGVIDSGRDDVKYEAYRGRKLDRAMLEVLREASA